MAQTFRTLAEFVASKPWRKRRRVRQDMRELIAGLRKSRHTFWTTGVHPPWYDEGQCPWFGGKTLAEKARPWLL